MWHSQHQTWCAVALQSVPFLFLMDQAVSLSMMEFVFRAAKVQAATSVQPLSLAELVQVEPFLAAPYAGLDLVVPLS